MESSLEVAHHLASGPAATMRFAKRAIYKGLVTDIEESMEYVGYARRLVASSGEGSEGTRSYLEKRAANFISRSPAATGLRSHLMGSSSYRPGPLAGLRVLELGEMVAAPACGRLLALMGAEVWKVEPPFLGDPARMVGPFADDAPNADTSALFLYLNTNKLGLTLDAALPAGRRLFYRLLEHVDLVIENLGFGVLDRLGIGYPHIASMARQVVVTSITPFGNDGLDPSRPADELSLLALGGVAAEFGTAGRAPLKPAGYQASHAAAYAALAGSLAALHARRTTGRGQLVDISVLEVVANCVQSEFTNFVHTGRQLKRGGRDGTTLQLPCADGPAEVSIFFGTQWAKLAHLVGRPDLCSDPRFMSAESRRANLTNAVEEIGAWTRTRTREEVYRAGQEAGLAIGYVASVNDVLSFGQEWVRGYFSSVRHPVAGEAVYPGLPALFDGWASDIHAAPALGEHNLPIYHDVLGLSLAHLGRLRQHHVI
jgi:crotonobetainyl-CoA:carnitine CoA-transferase CaiB-like acyl-CoA transferase